tara:strand:- start:90 stop:470 length:381 start_codon:yes stop_codon:yes gene_type:complete
MADFKLDYKIIGPQTYDRGDVGEKSKKLSRDTTRGSIMVNASSFEEAKKKARPLIKNSKTYERFSSRFSFDAPTKPRVKFLKPIKVGGTGDSPIKEISPKMLLDPRKELFKGGRVDKSIKGRSRYI